MLFINAIVTACNNKRGCETLAIYLALENLVLWAKPVPPCGGFFTLILSAPVTWRQDTCAEAILTIKSQK